MVDYFAKILVPFPQATIVNERIQILNHIDVMKQS
jgi:hypothetical protein